jgi:hypothetical protein
VRPPRSERPAPTGQPCNTQTRETVAAPGRTSGTSNVNVVESIKPQAFGACARLWAVLAASACSYDALLGQECPNSDPACHVAGASGNAGVGSVGGLGSKPDSGAPNANGAPLSAAIFDARGQPVSRGQLSCDASCLDVVAAAVGGAPPYTYVWSDGFAGSARRLCPDADASYTVQVQDSSPLPTTATASIALDRVGCAEDAGPSPAPRDCQTFPVGLLAACGNVGSASGTPQLRAGQHYTLRAHSMSILGGGNVQVQGVDAACALGDILAVWTLPSSPGETSACVVPTSDVTALLLMPLSGTSAEFLVNGSVDLCTGCE